MASTYTTNLTLEKPATGDQNNTWGATLRSNWDAIDAEFGKAYAGDPNTNVAGDYVGQQLYDSTNKQMWMCLVSGIAANAKWIQVGPHIGEVRFLAHDTVPSGWVECDGAAISRSTYALLFAAISTDFGVGDGSTTFNVPDFKGRSPVGKGQGDTAEGGGAGTDRSIGDEIGQETDTHQHDLSAHTHNISGHTHAFNGVTDGNNQTANSTGGGDTRPNSPHTHNFSGTTQSEGGLTTGAPSSDATDSIAIDTVSPGLVVKAIIYTGVPA